MKSLNYDKITKICLITFMVLSIILIFMFIPTGDDWAWGSQIGLDRLNSFFENYNGRYVSNILVIALTRFNWLRIIVEFFSIFLIIKLGSKLLINNNKYVWIYFLLLIILMPLKVFIQTIPWISGFVNYVFPVTLVFLNFNILKNYSNINIFSHSSKTISMLKILLLFIINFFCSMVIENLSVYNVVMSFILLIYYFIKTKKINYLYLIYFLGSVAGSICMFSNGAYGLVLEVQDTYRAININALKGNINSYILPYTINNNIFVLLSILLLFISCYKKNKLLLNNVFSRMAYIYIILFTTYNFITFMYTDWQIFLKYSDYFNVLCSIIYIISVIYLIYCTKANIDIKKHCYFYLASVFLLCAPLLLVNPIGPRNFLMMYVFEILFVLELMLYVFSENELRNNIIIVALILFVKYVQLINIYGYIYKSNYEEVNYIKNEIENKNSKIKYKQLPYGRYMHCSQLSKNSIWEKRYKIYYNIPEKVIFIYD